MSDARYAGAVRQHEHFWVSNGIHAVPSFILDRRYLIPGAQERDLFVHALKRVIEEQAE